MPGYKTFAPFERLLAEDLNTYYSEQVPAIFTNAGARDAAIPSPILGQPAYLTGLRALTRWNGSAWQFVAFAGGLPRATLTHNATQSIPNNTATKITLATVAEDMGGFALGSSELTVPAGLGGMYQLLGCIFWASQTTVVGYRDAHIRLAGTTMIARVIASQGTASIASIQSVGALVRLADLAVVSLWGAQTHGVAINSASDTYAPQLSIVRVGD